MCPVSCVKGRGGPVRRGRGLWHVQRAGSYTCARVNRNKPGKPNGRPPQARRAQHARKRSEVRSKVGKRFR